jgi:hypothetical protein
VVVDEDDEGVIGVEDVVNEVCCIDGWRGRRGRFLVEVLL